MNKENSEVKAEEPINSEVKAGEPITSAAAAAVAATTEAVAAANPLRDPRDKRMPRVAGPCVLVLFGVTGDLARKKLLPAIYDLANRGLLPPGFSLVGFARRDWKDQDFAELTHDGRQGARADAVPRGGLEAAVGGHLLLPGEFTDDGAFDALAMMLKEIDETRGTGGNYGFYLSVPPKFFPLVVQQLKRTDLRRRPSRELAPGGDREALRARPEERAGAERRSPARSSRRVRCSASTTTWARRPSRTSWRCGSPTTCSSRSGTAVTSTTCRSRWPRTSASAAGPVTTTASARPVT